MLPSATKQLTLKSTLWSPAGLTGLLLVLLVAFVIAMAGGDPMELARLGPPYTPAAADGEGYDGQFVYYIARNPDPQAVAPLLDVPAYRYQRILLPLLARLFSLGNVVALPWALALLGIVTQVMGTWAVGELLASWGVSRWYALSYGLFAGFTLAVRLDLPEPLSYGLVAGALLASARGRPGLSWVLWGLALFAREVSVLFVAAQLLADLLAGRWRDAAGLVLVALLPFGLFQGWLWWVFGQPGLGSGGAMATPFEWIPFMGLLRIGYYSLLYLGGMLVVFGPTVVWPAIWGAWKAVKFSLAGERNVIVLALFLNALAIACLPFSTFRETGGLLRFACGLVLALLLFASRYRMRRVLNYSLFWLVLNIFLFK